MFSDKRLIELNGYNVFISDYQVVFSDTVTDNVVTVTTEQQSDNLPVSNEMFLVEGKYISF